MTGAWVCALEKMPREPGRSGWPPWNPSPRGCVGRRPERSWWPRGQGPGGLPAQHRDRCPAGLFRFGLPKRGRTFRVAQGDSGIPVRLQSACRRAHPGGRCVLAQRAKVGWCLCCARTTHIAVPRRYAAGGFPEGKAHRLSRWTERDPWATGCYAACVYSQRWGSLPHYRVWAAQSLEIKAPPLFSELIGTVRAETCVQSKGVRELGKRWAPSGPRPYGSSTTTRSRDEPSIAEPFDRLWETAAELVKCGQQ